MAKLTITFEDGKDKGEVNMAIQVSDMPEDKPNVPTPAVNAGLQAWNMIKGILSAQAAQEKRIETPPEPELILPPGAKG